MAPRPAVRQPASRPAGRGPRHRSGADRAPGDPRVHPRAAALRHPVPRVQGCRPRHRVVPAGVRSPSARRSGDHARRPCRPRRASRRRHGVHARRRVSRGATPRARTRSAAAASRLMIHVPDSDARCRLAVAEGAEMLRPVTVQYGARSGVIRDPFGHRWFVATAIEPDDVPVEDVPGRRFGDVGYMTLEVPDGDRARGSTASCSAGRRGAATSRARSTSRPSRHRRESTDVREHRRSACTSGSTTSSRRRPCAELGGEVLADHAVRVRRQRRMRRRPRTAVRPVPSPPRLSTDVSQLRVGAGALAPNRTNIGH